MKDLGNCSTHLNFGKWKGDIQFCFRKFFKNLIPKKKLVGYFGNDITELYPWTCSNSILFISKNKTRVFPTQIEFIPKITTFFFEKHFKFEQKRTDFWAFFLTNFSNFPGRSQVVALAFSKGITLNKSPLYRLLHRISCFHQCWFDV